MVDKVMKATTSRAVAIFKFPADWLGLLGMDPTKFGKSLRGKSFGNADIHLQRNIYIFFIQSIA